MPLPESGRPFAEVAVDHHPAVGEPDHVDLPGIRAGLIDDLVDQSVQVGDVVDSLGRRVTAAPAGVPAAVPAVGDDHHRPAVAGQRAERPERGHDLGVLTQSVEHEHERETVGV